MRKIMYSNWMKFIAVMLFIASITVGALVATDRVIKYNNEEIELYNLGEDFYKSEIFVRMLTLPEEAVWSTVVEYYNEEHNNSNIADQTIVYQIRKYINAKSLSEKINYYIEWNGIVITNCDAQSPQELLQGDYYSFVTRDELAKVERNSTHTHNRIWSLDNLLSYDSTSKIVVACSVKSETVDEYKTIWQRQKSLITQLFFGTALCVIFALIVMIYLICVCGTNKDGKLKNMWLDNIWNEVHLLAIISAVACEWLICHAIIQELYATGLGNYNHIYLIVGITFAIASTVIITSLLAIIRNIKTQRVMKTSFIPALVKLICRLLVTVVKWIYRLIEGVAIFIIGLQPEKTVFMFAGLFIAYNVVVCTAIVASAQFPVWFLMCLGMFIFALITIIRRAKDLDEIKKGIKEVQSGNLTYKIPELKCVDTKELASTFNNISSGFDESLAAQVKSERLKTELITNVSHDIKTPITSIINYTELLSKVEGLPDEARDYVVILANKSDRLKKLTQDLFDISKAQSGNDNAIMEKLDVSLLIAQSLAEHESEIQKSQLEFCTNVEKDTYILADGRKMSRVLSNLIGNVLKYSMKNTRVFVTANSNDNNVSIQIKNISAYPLDFDVEEITQRFVRGDESRTQDGNGLGLAIAKSYTELCGGELGIIIDGDMFKVTLSFKRYEEE